MNMVLVSSKTTKEINRSQVDFHANICDTVSVALHDVEEVIVLDRLHDIWISPSAYRNIDREKLWKVASVQARTLHNGLLLIHNAVFRGLNAGGCFFIKIKNPDVEELFSIVLQHIGSINKCNMNESMYSFIDSVYSEDAFFDNDMVMPFSYHCNESTIGYSRDQIFLFILSDSVCMCSKNVKVMVFIVTNDIIRTNVIMAKTIAVIKDELVQRAISSCVEEECGSILQTILAAERALDSVKSVCISD